MQLKIFLKSSLFILSIMGIIFSSMIILFLVLKPTPPISGQTAQNQIAGAAVETPENIAAPAEGNLPASQAVSKSLFRLKIPSIKIDAAVESVGLTPDGDMDVPIGATNTGWYNRGPRPGEKGSAVIDGHSGKWKDGLVGVFDNLNKLQSGDKIQVLDGSGIVSDFVVREIRTYDPAADSSEVFSSKDGNAHLNLITCEGVWNEETKSYSARLVVFTDKINEQ